MYLKNEPFVLTESAVFPLSLTLAFPFLARDTPILNPAISPSGSSCDNLLSLLKLSEDIITQALEIINGNCL